MNVSNLTPTIKEIIAATANLISRDHLLKDMLLRGHIQKTLITLKSNEKIVSIDHLLIVSKDFNLKSQLMRALEINALNSYKILF